MVNFPGRNGRRRRVLNEEVLSASSSHTSRQSSSNDSASGAPRYSDAAGVENHPQVTDFIPRRYRTIVLMLVAGVVTTISLGALHYFGDAIAAAAGLPDRRPFDLSAPSSMADWISAIALVVASALSLLIYSLRRHRIDDIRGRYRVWLAASLACLLLSANSVTGFHAVAAHSLGHFTGWTALRSGAAWWLLLAGLPLGWIALRVLLDVKECRLAGALTVAALTCHAAAAASYLGLISQAAPQNEALITNIGIFLGHWLSLATIVSYARFVVLDAQGLVTVRRTATKKQTKTKQSRETKSAEGQPTVLSVAGYTRQKPTPAATPATPDKWVDGSRPERVSYDDDADDEDEDSGVHKLSKADRKKLRKLKAQNRAA
jgi:hypothetical protein